MTTLLFVKSIYLEPLINILVFLLTNIWPYDTNKCSIIGNNYKFSFYCVSGCCLIKIGGGYNALSSSSPITHLIFGCPQYPQANPAYGPGPMETNGYPIATNSVVCENSVWLIDCTRTDVWCMDGNANPAHPAIGKLTLTSSKLKASAVSFCQAVVVEVCTALGKPKPIGNICPEACIVMHNMAATSNAPATDFPIALTIPLDDH